MDRIGFMLMVVLATTTYSAAVNQEKVCGDSGICVFLNPTDDHYKFNDPMDAIVQNNKNFTDLQRVNDFDDSFDPDPGDEQNCWAETTIKKPYVIETNASSDSKSLVVQVKGFLQKIKWTVCRDNNPKQTCFGNVFTDGISRVETQCGEKYGAVSLYIYDPVENEIRYQMYEIPVACVCRFRNE